MYVEIKTIRSFEVPDILFVVFEEFSATCTIMEEISAAVCTGVYLARFS